MHDIPVGGGVEAGQAAIAICYVQAAPRVGHLRLVRVVDEEIVRAACDDDHNKNNQQGARSGPCFKRTEGKLSANLTTTERKCTETRQRAPANSAIMLTCRE